MEEMKVRAQKDALCQKDRYTFEDLLTIVRILRSPEGCPWDRVQTHASLRPCLIEETYEAAEGIDLGNEELLCEELGDVLLQVIFHAVIAEETGEFTLSDVIGQVCRKMIDRHEHVFGGETVESAEEMEQRWEKIKERTRPSRTVGQDMDCVAKSLPALIRSQKIAKKAQAADLISVTAQENTDLGKALFDLTAQAQMSGVSAEDALHAYLDSVIETVKESEKCEKTK